MDLLRSFQVALADDARGATEIERQLTAELLDHRPKWVFEALLQGASLLGREASMANLRHLAAVIEGAVNMEEIEHRLRERRIVNAQGTGLLLETAVGPGRGPA